MLFWQPKSTPCCEDVVDSVFFIVIRVKFALLYCLGSIKCYLSKCDKLNRFLLKLFRLCCLRSCEHLKPIFYLSVYRNSMKFVFGHPKFWWFRQYFQWLLDYNKSTGIGLWQSQFLKTKYIHHWKDSNLWELHHLHKWLTFFQFNGKRHPRLLFCVQLM
jgi:hypothetical protein